eukprot:TRINITY_DN9637_c0_g1_i1.p1 TRINITY_DN9637_c0_g1~~TRINITY_DN9637_c0_g1_i1.p1  ORF type:complete len:142 (-),score=52.28 TRINITY_DN9637_c0_g1_i1:229-654(-)
MARIFSITRLPVALVQAFGMVVLSGIWMAGFAWFWTFMVIELPKDLGPYSQMSSLSMFMHRAFPMRETNDISFEYKFEHILMMACVMALIMAKWAPTRRDVQDKIDKAAAKSKKKGGKKATEEEEKEESNEKSGKKKAAAK